MNLPAFSELRLRIFMPLLLLYHCWEPWLIKHWLTLPFLILGESVLYTQADQCRIEFFWTNMNKLAFSLQQSLHINGGKAYRKGLFKLSRIMNKNKVLITEHVNHGTVCSSQCIPILENKLNTIEDNF
jgi:hypothetical protein